MTPHERVEYAAQMLDNWAAELQEARQRGMDVPGKPTVSMVMEQALDVSSMATANVNVAMAQLTIEANRDLERAMNEGDGSESL